MCVGFCRRPCRRCVFCPSRPGAACSPCWTDGHTGASPGSAAGASPSPSSTIKKVERLSSTSKANTFIIKHTHQQLRAHIYCICLKFLFLFFFLTSIYKLANICDSLTFTDTLCPTSHSSSKKRAATVGGSFPLRLCCLPRCSRRCVN